MTLRFKDEIGRCGKVTESLEIDYSGPWEEEVIEIVEEADGEIPEEVIYDSDDPLSYLVIELPENAPIVEAYRDESRGTPSRD